MRFSSLFTMAALLTAPSVATSEIVVQANATFENEQSMRFYVTRTIAATSVQTVEFFTRDDTALAGVDYLPRAGTLTFLTNQTQLVIDVPLIDNGLVDGDRSLFLILTNPVPCANLWQFGSVCFELPPGGLPPYIGEKCKFEGPIIKDNEHPATRLDSSFIPQEPAGMEMPDGRVFQDNQMWLPDGTVDPQFFLGGKVNAQYGDLHPLADGKLLALYSPPSRYEWRLVRLLPNGSVDLDFAPQPVNTQFRAELPNHQLLISQTTDSSEKVYRLNPDGSRDLSFSLGIERLWRIARLVVLPDGPILLKVLLDQGNGTAVYALRRLHSDGSIDPSFNPGPGEVSDFFLRRSGKLVVQRRVLPELNWEIVQINEDGTVDPTFALDPNVATSPETWMEQSDGRILIARGFAVRRLNVNGSVDTEFAPEFHSPCTSVGHFLPKLGLTPSGQILFSGFFDRIDGFPVPGVARLLDKTPQPEFRLFTSRLKTTSDLAQLRASERGQPHMQLR